MIQHSDFQKLVLEWVGGVGKGRGCIAFTGSARQCLHHPSGAVQWISDTDLADNVRWVSKYATRAAFSRKGERSGRRLLYAGSIEGGNDGKRLHVHLTIGGYQTVDEMHATMSAFASRWCRSRWGYNNVHVRALRNFDDQQAWKQYSIKHVRMPTMHRFITNVPYQAV